MEIIKSVRGGDIFCYEGYQLHVNYKRIGKVYWRCRHINCKFTVITEEDAVVSQKGTHCHPTEVNKITIKRALSDAKVVAVNTPFVPIKRVYNEAFREVDMLDETIMDELPSLNKYRSSESQATSKGSPYTSGD